MLSSITWEGAMWLFLIFSPIIPVAYLAITGIYSEIKDAKPKPKAAQPTPTLDA